MIFMLNIFNAVSSEVSLRWHRVPSAAFALVFFLFRCLVKQSKIPPKRPPSAASLMLPIFVVFPTAATKGAKSGCELQKVPFVDAVFIL